MNIRNMEMVLDGGEDEEGAFIKAFNSGGVWNLEGYDYQIISVEIERECTTMRWPESNIYVNVVKVGLRRIKP